MNEIDVESILRDVRMEIVDKGYTEDNILFKKTRNAHQNFNEFLELSELNNSINQMQERRYVLWSFDLKSKGIVYLIKKFIRDLGGFLMIKIWEQQNGFNESVSVGFYQMQEVIKKQNIIIEQNNIRIKELEERMYELERK